MNMFEHALGLACGKTDYQMMQEDQYRAIKKSAALQALQVGLLANMTESLGAIHEQVAQARGLQAEALALQQEMLAREQLQAHLEEFVYQAEKLVAECHKQNTDLPPSSRFHLLNGVLQQIEQDGIATAIIRGRDNKAAFDRVLKDVQQLHKNLLNHPEVTEAIAWAAKINKQRAEQRRQIELKMKPYLEQIEKLKTEKNPVTFRDAWNGWKERTSNWFSKRGVITKVLFWVILFPLIFIYSILIIPGFLIFLVFRHQRLNRERNAEIDAQIQEIEKKLCVLQEKLEKV